MKLNQVVVIDEYQNKDFPVDAQISNLPLFIKSKVITQRVTHVINEEKNILIEVSNHNDSVPNDFDRKIYFALVKVAIDYKDKIYASLFDKIQRYMLANEDKYNYTEMFDEYESMAIHHKLTNYKTLFDKVKFIKEFLGNLQDNAKITPVYTLTTFNLECLDKFLNSLNSQNRNFAEYRLLIEKLKTQHSDLNKDDLLNLTKLLDDRDFQKIANNRLIPDLLGDLISSKIKKSNINILLNDYDFRYGSEIIPTEIYFTYYDIVKYIGDTRKNGKISERIFKSLERLKASLYKLWNCAYDVYEGKISGLKECNFNNSIDVFDKSDSNSKSFSAAMTNLGVIKSNKIIRVTLEKFFINNLMERKGHLLYHLNTIINMEDSIALSIFLYCDRNRWWLGRKQFKTDKKIALSAMDLAIRVPLVFTPSTVVPKSIKRINQALDYLKINRHILDYEFIKGKPLAKSSYIISFAESRHEYDSERLPLDCVLLETKESVATDKICKDLFASNVELSPELTDLIQDHILSE